MVLPASIGLMRKKNPNPIRKSNPTMSSIIHALRPHAAIKSAAIVLGTEVEMMMKGKIAEIEIIIAGALRKIGMDEVATEIAPRRDGSAAAKDERADPDLPNATEAREETKTIPIGETESIHDANGTENYVPTTMIISETWIDAPGAIVITTTTIGAPG